MPTRWYINWHNATAYAKSAGKRLPTEAKWEYAACGGLVGKRYSWGDEEPDGIQPIPVGMWEKPAPLIATRPTAMETRNMG